MRRASELADTARTALSQDAQLGAVRCWVRTELSDDEARECASQWIRSEVQKIRRADVLVLERINEAPTPKSDSIRPVRRESKTPDPEISQLVGDVTTLVERHRNEFAVRWTVDLLRQPLQMPDGSGTTWGDATVAQHALRASMFERYATTNIEGAARHRQAIVDLDAAGVPTLNALIGGTHVAV